MNTRPAPTPHVLALILIAVAGPLSLNIFVPVLPLVARDLAATPDQVQWSLSLYLIAVAAGQLIYGPISDSKGRRPVLLVGLSLFLIGSVICCLATTIELLLIGRIIQGIGGCAGMVLSRVIAMDISAGGNAAKLMAYILMGVSIAPAIAPFLGGFFAETYGWTSTFYAMVIYGALIAILCLWLIPETLPSEKSTFSTKTLLRANSELLQKRDFLVYLLCASGLSGTFFGFLGGAPYIVAKLFSDNVADYGKFYPLIAIGVMVGGYLASRLSVKKGEQWTLYLGLGVCLAGTLGLCVLAALGVMTMLLLFLPMAIFAVGRAVSYANLAAIIMGIIPKYSGAASGLMGFSHMLSGAIFSQVAAWVVHYHVFYFTLLMFLGVSIAAASLLFLRPVELATTTKSTI